jgi:Rrf2 family protein
MRVSVKGRYALASMICIAENYGKNECTTVLSISEKLGVSKIYLEQVFSLLKRGGLVTSLKGAQGGYQLARLPKQINAGEILSAAELSLFEGTEDTCVKNAPEINRTMLDFVFNRIDDAINELLSGITLAALAEESIKAIEGLDMMFYI